MELLFEQSRATDSNHHDDARSPAVLQPLNLELLHYGRYDDALRAVIYAHIRAGVGKDRIVPLVAVSMGLLTHNASRNCRRLLPLCE